MPVFVNQIKTPAKKMVKPETIIHAKITLFHFRNVEVTGLATYTQLQKLFCKSQCTLTLQKNNYSQFQKKMLQFLIFMFMTKFGTEFQQITFFLPFSIMREYELPWIFVVNGPPRTAPKIC
jgi:hypothetical protein